jgi:hypothetical protein
MIGSKTKFAACIVDTGGKIAFCITTTAVPVVNLDLRKSPEIFEKFEMTQMLFQGLRGR